MKSLLIADAQAHVWAAPSHERPWPVKNPPHIPHKGRQAFLAEELLQEMDAAGVQSVVLTPPGWQGDHDHDLEFAAVQQYPDRFAIMGRLDVSAPGARDRIRTWNHRPGMLGLRFGPQLPPDSMDWVWYEAQAARLPIMLSAGGQLQRVDRIAHAYPELRLIVDHFGAPSRTKDQRAFADFDQLLALAKRSNVAVKASSLPSFVTDVYPYRWLHPYIQRAYDAFGNKRLFWGSDLSNSPCSYRQTIALYTEELPWLSEEDKQWIMGRGLCEWINWKLY